MTKQVVTNPIIKKNLGLPKTKNRSSKEFSSLLDRFFLLFFLYIFYYLFFQKQKIGSYYIPYNIIINLKILMNNIISHAIHLFPRSIGMRFSKFFS